MLTVVNRNYCKKLLVIFADQTHPEQYHKKKSSYEVKTNRKNRKIELYGVM